MWTIRIDALAVALRWRPGRQRRRVEAGVGVDHQRAGGDAEAESGDVVLRRRRELALEPGRIHGHGDRLERAVPGVVEQRVGRHRVGRQNAGRVADRRHLVGAGADAAAGDEIGQGRQRAAVDADEALRAVNAATDFHGVNLERRDQRVALEGRRLERDHTMVIRAPAGARHHVAHERAVDGGVANRVAVLVEDFDRRLGDAVAVVLAHHHRDADEVVIDRAPVPPLTGAAERLVGAGIAAAAVRVQPRPAVAAGGAAEKRAQLIRLQPTVAVQHHGGHGADFGRRRGRARRQVVVELRRVAGEGLRDNRLGVAVAVEVAVNSSARRQHIHRPATVGVSGPLEVALGAQPRQPAARMEVVLQRRRTDGDDVAEGRRVGDQLAAVIAHRRDHGHPVSGGVVNCAGEQPAGEVGRVERQRHVDDVGAVVHRVVDALGQRQLGAAIGRVQHLDRHDLGAASDGANALVGGDDAGHVRAVTFIVVGMRVVVDEVPAGSERHAGQIRRDRVAAGAIAVALVGDAAVEQGHAHAGAAGAATARVEPHRPQVPLQLDRPRRGGDAGALDDGVRLDRQHARHRRQHRARSLRRAPVGESEDHGPAARGSPCELPTQRSRGIQQGPLGAGRQGDHELIGDDRPLTGFDDRSARDAARGARRVSVRPGGKIDGAAGSQQQPQSRYAAHVPRAIASRHPAGVRSNSRAMGGPAGQKSDFLIISG